MASNWQQPGHAPSGRARPGSGRRSKPGEDTGEAGPAAVLFVCTGNICRSPMAEAVMRRLADDAGLADQLVVDSAGTGGWHAGDPADERAAAAAAARGYEVSGVARQVTRLDFADFDLLVAMDHYNLRYLRDLAPDREARLKARLLLRDGDVPDPYNGPAAAFERALDLIVAGCRELLAEMTAAPG